MAETVALAASNAAGPVTLGARPVSVTLTGSRSSPPGPRSDEQIYLVLDRIETDGAVNGVVEVYLDLPAETQPQRDSPHYIGDINFFDAAAGRRGASFNITQRIADLRHGNSLTPNPTVMLVPNGEVPPIARARIGAISIVSRTP